VASSFLSNVASSTVTKSQPLPFSLPSTCSRSCVVVVTETWLLWRVNEEEEETSLRFTPLSLLDLAAERRRLSETAERRLGFVWRGRVGERVKVVEIWNGKDRREEEAHVSSSIFFSFFFWFFCCWVFSSFY